MTNIEVFVAKKFELVLDFLDSVFKMALSSIAFLKSYK